MKNVFQFFILLVALFFASPVFSQPMEDNCLGAIDITVASGVCGAMTVGNNLNSTDSSLDVPPPPTATCSSYGGGDIWFKFTVPASGDARISGANSDGCCSFLWYEVYSGVDCSSLISIGCSDTSNGTDNNDPSTYETSLSGLTPNDVIWIRAWDSFNNDGPGDFNFCVYEPDCTAPTISFPSNPIDNTNCPATIDVTISIDNFGDAGTLTISAEDDMGNTAGTGGTTMSAGLFVIEDIPVPQTSWSIIVSHDASANCEVVLGPFLLDCPPPNDNLCDAQALTVDATPVPGTNLYATVQTAEPDPTCWLGDDVNNSVWYSFVAPGSGLVEITTDFVTGLTDSQIALYSTTDCSDLTNLNFIACDDDSGVNGSGFMSIIETSAAPLVGGDTYFIQVDGYNDNEGAFEIQVNESAPANDDCSAAIAINTIGSITNQYFAAATPSGIGPEACDVAGVPTPKDVWYSIETDADGGVLVISVQPDPQSNVVIAAVYDACGAPVPEQCSEFSGNGGVGTLNLSVMANSTYYLRVYEWIKSGQPFTINFSGSGLLSGPCTAPTISFPSNPIDNTNCPATIDLTISIDDMGNAGTLTISAEDDMGNAAGTGGTTMSAGLFVIEDIPVPQTSWSIIVNHDASATCDVVLGPFLLDCPPPNDNLCDAEALTVDATPVSGTNLYATIQTAEPDPACWIGADVNSSVWYSFVAPGSGIVEITTDFVTGLTDSQIALYSTTDCSDLTNLNFIACDDDSGVNGTGFMSIIETSTTPLVGGDTYFIQVDGYNDNEGAFEIQVNESTPANDDCNTATVINTFAPINEYFAAATPSGIGPEACDASGVPTPNDIWYSIDSDAIGGQLGIAILPGPQSDIVIAVYDACGTPVPEVCFDLGGDGGIEIFVFIANPNSTYFIRVYEKLKSGQPFMLQVFGAVLPIELVDFRAKAMDAGNKIMWTTASEINNDYQMIQKSENGISEWEEVGRVNGNHYSLGEKNYEIMDNAPYHLTYYRIFSVDLDGSTQISDVISVIREGKGNAVEIYPNPTKALTTLKINSGESDVANILIFDISGKVVQEKTIDLYTGQNDIQIDMSEFPDGIYNVTINSNHITEVLKFIKS